MNNRDNPTQLAEYFSEIQKRFGFNFDFSVESLKTSVDKFLDENKKLSQFTQTLIEPILTAYIGETLCRNYNGNWKGEFRNSINQYGSNYYDCWIEIDQIKFWPSHFIAYCLHNGKNKNDFREYIIEEIKKFENKKVL